VAPPLETIGDKYKSFQDIFDNFNLPELAKYCKEKGLKTSGKKKDVIKRVLHFIETGSTEEPQKRKKAAKGAKGSKKQKVDKAEASEETKIEADDATKDDSGPDDDSKEGESKTE